MLSFEGKYRGDGKDGGIRKFVTMGTIEGIQMLHLERDQLEDEKNIRYLKDFGVKGENTFVRDTQIKHDTVHVLSPHLQRPTMNGEECVKWGREVEVEKG